MSELHLVRHGQASVRTADYDRLSTLGSEQSHALGDYWAARGMHFDRVLVGPRQRHRQTLEAVAAAYRSRGLRWPEAEPLEALDEHCGPELFDHYRERLMPVSVGSAAEDLRFYLSAYQDATRKWARGELQTPPQLEPWPAFRRRVEEGLAEIAGGGRGVRVAAFTSGGAVAAAAGHALGIGDEKVIELSWRVKNAAISQLLFAPGRGFALETFNATPHLESGLVTHI